MQGEAELNFGRGKTAPPQRRRWKYSGEKIGSARGRSKTVAWLLSVKRTLRIARLILAPLIQKIQMHSLGCCLGKRRSNLRMRTVARLPTSLQNREMMPRYRSARKSPDCRLTMHLSMAPRSRIRMSCLSFAACNLLSIEGVAIKPRRISATCASWILASKLLSFWDLFWPALSTGDCKSHVQPHGADPLAVVKGHGQPPGPIHCVLSEATAHRQPSGPIHWLLQSKVM